MNANEFVKELKEIPQTNNDNFSDKLFFETDAGKEVIHYIKKNAEIRDNSFVLTNDCLREIENLSVYKGRNFFNDMEELGFSRTCVSLHTNETTTISKHLFEPKKDKTDL